MDAVGAHIGRMGPPDPVFPLCHHLGLVEQSADECNGSVRSLFMGIGRCPLDGRAPSDIDFTGLGTSPMMTESSVLFAIYRFRFTIFYPRIHMSGIKRKSNVKENVPEQDSKGVLICIPYLPASRPKIGDWVIPSSQLDPSHQRDFRRWWYGLTWQSWGRVERAPQRGTKRDTSACTTILRVSDSANHKAYDEFFYYDLCWWNPKTTKWMSAATNLGQSWSVIENKAVQDEQVAAMEEKKKAASLPTGGSQPIQKGDHVAFSTPTFWPTDDVTWSLLSLSGTVIEAPYDASTMTVGGAVICIDIQLNEQELSGIWDVPAEVRQSKRVTMAKFWDNQQTWYRVSKVLDATVTSPLSFVELDMIACHRLAFSK